MVTKDQAIAAGYRDEFHFGECKRVVGPRGGVTIKQVRCRVNGRCQTWKTRPSEFRLPVKAGLYEHGEITERNAGDFHRECDCPLAQES